MPKKRIILPKKFTEKTWKWMGEPEEFKDFIGMYCASYSQIEGFASYKKDWIKNYCFGIKEDPGMFANFGTAVGKLIETRGAEIDSFWLNDDTLDALADKFYPETCEYEKPIHVVIDVHGTPVLIYGFIDVYNPIEKPEICDIKTGSAEKKAKYYASSEYMQTRLYAHALALQGIEVGRCYVHLFDRRGNGTSAHPIRLTGIENFIETPYVKEEVEQWIDNKVIPTLVEISDFYQTYKKIFK